MQPRMFVLSALVAAALTATSARSQTCDDLLDVVKAITGEESALGGALKEFGEAKTLIDAFQGAEEGKKADAVARVLGESALTFAFGDGASVVLEGGKATIGGVEWTIAEATRLQTGAFLCEGVVSGSGIRVDGVFKTPGAQKISPRITCENYPDFLDTPARFEAFRQFFWGHYKRTVGAMGVSQSLLDRQWAVIEPTWKVAEAKRRLRRLEEELARRLAEGAVKMPAECKVKPPPAELGADNSDPAKLPEPVLPPGGMLVLTETVVTPHSLDPSISHTAAPQRNTVSAYFGEAVCSWSAPPKALLTEEVFGLDFSLSVTSKNQQRYNEQLSVRSGFANVGETPNEIAAGVEPGGNASAKGHLELGAGDLAFAQDYMTWYLQIGGCGGNVDYLYKFKKP